MKYIAWLAAIVIGVFLAKFLGTDTLWSKTSGGVYDAMTTCTWGEPNCGLKHHFRNIRRSDLNESLQLASQPVNEKKLPRGQTRHDVQFKQDILAARDGFRAKREEDLKNAELEGIRVETAPLYTVNAQSSAWQPTFKKVFEGDIICTGGSVYNELYMPHGQVLQVGPGGVDEQTIDGHAREYKQFPMLAFLGRVNGNDNTIMHLHGCVPSNYEGLLELKVNNPYWNPNGLAAPGFANYSHGNFSIIRLEQ